jgi:hypothetical protein
MMMRAEWDCSARAVRTLAVYFYDAKGTVIHSESPDPILVRWEDVIPDSQGETMLRWVCATFDAK